MRLLPSRLVSIWNGRHVPTNAPGDPRRGVMARIPGKVSVLGCRLNMDVAYQLADHREAFVQRPRSIRIALMVVLSAKHRGRTDRDWGRRAVTRGAFGRGSDRFGIRGIDRERVQKGVERGIHTF